MYEHVAIANRLYLFWGVVMGDVKTTTAATTTVDLRSCWEESVRNPPP